MRTLLALALLALAPAVRAQDTVLFQEDFESGLSNWTAETLWHLQDSSETCSSLVAPFPSGTKCAWFGSQAWCAIAPPSGSSWFDGFLTQNTPIDLPPTARTIRLSLRTSSQGEDDDFWDRRSVEIKVDEGAEWIRLPSNVFTSSWQTAVWDLTPWAGHTIRLRLEYWTGDWWVNDVYGWFVDDITITALDDAAIPFCTGDGTDGACPCGNVGGAGRGCPSSFHAAGARLSASGIPSLTNDTLTITAADVSPAVVTFFGGPTRNSSGPAYVFGDGRRCVTGSVVRVQAPPSNGAAQIPVAGGAALSTKFNVSLGSPTRYVQALYRNAAPFCTNQTFNLTNGLIVTWRP